MRTLMMSYLLIGISGVAVADRRHNEIIHNEASVEATIFQMSNATGNGFILAKECQTCPEVRLNVNVRTQAYFNSKPVPLTQVPAVATSSITVIYDPKTMNAKRIVW